MNFWGAFQCREVSSAFSGFNSFQWVEQFKEHREICPSYSPQWKAYSWKRGGLVIDVWWFSLFTSSCSLPTLHQMSQSAISWKSSRLWPRTETGTTGHKCHIQCSQNIWNWSAVEINGNALIQPEGFFQKKQPRKQHVGVEISNSR